MKNLAIDFLTGFFKVMFWVADSHLIWGSLLAAATAIVCILSIGWRMHAVTALLTLVLLVYTFMLFYSLTMDKNLKKSLLISVNNYKQY